MARQSVLGKRDQRGKICFEPKIRASQPRQNGLLVWMRTQNQGRLQRRDGELEQSDGSSKAHSSKRSDETELSKGSSRDERRAASSRPQTEANKKGDRRVGAEEECGPLGVSMKIRGGL
jgi:hypothetical protein